MRTATIQIRKNTSAALDEFGDAFVRAWKTGRPEGDIYRFESPKSLFATLTPKRWELVETLQTIGPSSLRVLARALNRDVKRVHDDAAALLTYGLVERREDRKLWVPYGVIHIDFDLRAAA